MNIELLIKHINDYKVKMANKPDDYRNEQTLRAQDVKYYRSFDKNKILSMSDEDIYEYFSKLWALIMWGNKRYRIDQIVNENGKEKFLTHIADLIWGEDTIENRWNNVRKNIKHIGPSMMSELLCKTHPEEFMLLNRRVIVAFNYLEVDDVPKYDIKVTGKVYTNLNKVCHEISRVMKEEGIEDSSLYAVDYFLWSELQITEDGKETSQVIKIEEDSLDVSKNDDGQFIHNEIRDKICDIGQWLGFVAKSEHKVFKGSVVDALWESSIGNMGRIMYIFEVQTKGSIDSLVVNLLQSANNPAVQGVVAVSDEKQLNKLKEKVVGIYQLHSKIKYWNYEDVLKVHENLENAHSIINNLDLIPQ